MMSQCSPNTSKQVLHIDNTWQNKDLSNTSEVAAGQAKNDMVIAVLQDTQTDTAESFRIET